MLKKVCGKVINGYEARVICAQVVIYDPLGAAWDLQVEHLHLICIYGALQEEGKIYFFDIELMHAGAQGAAVESENFSCTVFSAYFPLGLFRACKCKS